MWYKEIKDHWSIEQKKKKNHTYKLTHTKIGTDLWQVTKEIPMRNNIVLNPQCWSNWIFRSKKKKKINLNIKSRLTLCTKINSEWNVYLNVKFKTIKILKDNPEEKVGLMITFCICPWEYDLQGKKPVKLDFIMKKNTLYKTM